MKSKYSAEQMVQIMNEAKASKNIQDVARKYAISSKTISNWRTKFGGMKSEDLKNQKTLEEENAQPFAACFAASK
jgi:hypothetical protein